MAYGFYVTDRGLGLIGEAMSGGGAVRINQYAVGDGGDLDGPRDGSITKLGNELWRKTLDDRDSFAAEGTRLTIKTVIPETAPAMVFNEVGYFDESGELIIYGTMRGVSKGESDDSAPQVLEHENIIEFSGDGIAAVQIVTGNLELDGLSGRVSAVENGKADKSELDTLKETITSEVTGKLTALESTVTNTVQADLSELERRVGAIEGQLTGLAETLERLV